MSLPAFGNVGALIGLLFFMYAYVGVLVFGRVRRDDASYINSSANFANFAAAMSALFRVATGDNWTDVMYGCMLKVWGGGRCGERQVDVRVRVRACFAAGGVLVPSVLRIRTCPRSPQTLVARRQPVIRRLTTTIALH